QTLRRYRQNAMPKTTLRRPGKQDYDPVTTSHTSITKQFRIGTSFQAQFESGQTLRPLSLMSVMVRPSAPPSPLCLPNVPGLTVSTNRSPMLQEILTPLQWDSFGCHRRSKMSNNQSRLRSACSVIKSRERAQF